MANRNKKITEMVEDLGDRRSPMNDPRYRDAQRWRNYWMSRQIENLRMQDEGDMIAGPKPGPSKRLLIVYAILTLAVVYVLLTAALVLIPNAITSR